MSRGFPGSKQVKKNCQCIKKLRWSQSSFYTTEIEDMNFHLEDDDGILWVEMIIFTVDFLVQSKL